MRPQSGMLSCCWASHKYNSVDTLEVGTSLVDRDDEEAGTSPISRNFKENFQEVEEKVSDALRKFRGCMFSLALLIIFPTSLGVLSMLFYCLTDNDNLATTTQILVIADTFWKASYYTFWCIGVVTVISASIGSEADNDWVKLFWSVKAPVNVKSWQATGFILQPLGLYVLGAFLFTTQIVLKESIQSGSAWLELSPLEKETKKCFFIEQVDWQTAYKSPSLQLYENNTYSFASNFSRLLDLPSAWNTNCSLSSPYACTFQKYGIKYTKLEPKQLPILAALWDLWRKYVRLTVPSQCYGADSIRHWPAFNVPDKDFALLDVEEKNASFRNFRFAPAYLGAEGSLWNRTRTYYFAESVRTACHYECAEWAEETAVTKLLQLSMVVGGGLAIVKLSDTLGGYLGNRLINRDTKVDELAKVIAGDCRVSLTALTRHSLWCPPQEEQQRVYFWYCWRALFLLLVKVACAVGFTRFYYRPLVVKYSESMADRGLVRCIFYVGLFNMALRSLFCFTSDMWNTGEDSGFHKAEAGKEQSVLFTRRNFDLYNWMRLNTSEIIEYLFDYTYNLGEEELANDHDIDVRMRFDTNEDQYQLKAGAKGRIVKKEGYGAQYEGSKVFVTFAADQVKVVMSGFQRSSKNLGTEVEEDSGVVLHRIPIEKNSLAEVGATAKDNKDMWQEELRKFLGMEPDPVPRRLRASLGRDTSSREAKEKT